MLLQILQQFLVSHLLGPVRHFAQGSLHSTVFAAISLDIVVTCAAVVTGLASKPWAAVVRSKLATHVGERIAILVAEVVPHQIVLESPIELVLVDGPVGIASDFH
jgi:hypothetical protein